MYSLVRSVDGRATAAARRRRWPPRWGRGGLLQVPQLLPGVPRVPRHLGGPRRAAELAAACGPAEGAGTGPIAGPTPRRAARRRRARPVVHGRGAAARLRSRSGPRSEGARPWRRNPEPTTWPRRRRRNSSSRAPSEGKATTMKAVEATDRTAVVRVDRIIAAPGSPHRLRRPRGHRRAGGGRGGCHPGAGVCLLHRRLDLREGLAVRSVGHEKASRRRPRRR